MKKIIAIVGLCIMLACCATATAAFAESCEQHIVEIATAHDKVVEAQCVVYNRMCVLALKTEKFNTKSDYDKFKEELCAKIETDCEIDFVFVTRSPKVMYKLTQLNKLSEDERKQAIEELIENELHRHNKGDKKPIQPRML